MKTQNVVFVASCLLSVLLLSATGFSNAEAGGFKCTHPNYHVQIYNTVDPKTGTEVPSILILSNKAEGTLLKLQSSNIVKTPLDQTTEYTGEGNLVTNGHFASVSVNIDDEADFDEIGPKEHQGVLTFNSDAATTTLNLACFEYQSN